VQAGGLGADDLGDGLSDQTGRTVALPLQPTPERIHATLIPVQPEHHVINGFDETAEALFAGLQRMLRGSAIAQLTGVADQPAGCRPDPEGKSAIEEAGLGNLDLGSLRMGSEGLGLEARAGQSRERLPQAVSQQIGSAQAEAIQIAGALLVDMRDVPFVIAAQEGFTHAVQYLSRVALERTFPEQNCESIVTGIHPYFHSAAITAVEHLVHDGDLLGMRTMQRPPQ
jgi:hypothetical protein